mmetsp:Transcript_19225/g.27381  ORF Transcript_19225/g.27381 Transcript_19225/m.27381 type:complete len:128 (+) Transcript_19225:100-483(+)|eukprot:CAMPEP_0172421126 /NCGR_PEP_ID=MMETSP1064-20121228/7410_1 /TAXON_ID=202472 /ORGANISM="Aulacoseira subarctica , Strain CCAP 1002/5" /LENGTH=127 /DNA_ID=CAMNT_0013161387 /DNA_START=55 /DNA_END=438 /DNA_ORIENTATION=-
MKSSKSPGEKSGKKRSKGKESKESSKRSANSSSSVVGNLSAQSSSNLSAKQAPSGYLISCDIPMKQFILKLNDDKIADKKFVLEDIDETHLLIDGRAREEIRKAAEEWMDENIWSSAERVGENLGLD